jgi:branched-chain amino acid transport system substrate-binding protein
VIRPAPAAGAAPLVRASAEKSVVKIGTLGAFSGVIGAVTEAAPKTLAAWAAYTNAHGGLDGHPVKIVVGDDQGDPATSLTLAKRMVESDKVIAMANNVLLFSYPQVEKYMREKNIAMIGGDGIDPGWYTSPVAFPIAPAFSVQMIKGLKMLVDGGTRKLAVLYCVEISQLCTFEKDQAAKSEVGGYIAQTYQVSIVAPSYTSQCLRMKEAGIDGVLLLLETASAARVSQDCASQGFKPKFLLLGLDATREMPTIPALSAALIPGATASLGARDFPAIQAYERVMAEYGPTIGESGVSALAWSTAQLLSLIGRNLPDDPGPADIFNQLWQVKNETLGGLTVPFSYHKGGLPDLAPCMFVWGVSNNRFSAPNGVKPSC